MKAMSSQGHHGPIELPLLPLRFHLEGDGALRLAELTGAVRMRGAFGLFFRRLVCPPPWWSRECRSCELWRSCAYPTFFEPAPPAEASRLRLNANVPRPYVFRSAGNDTAFDVTLIGRGCEALPYLILAVRQIGEDGFGPARRRYRLRHVSTREPAPRVVFDSSSPVVHNLAPAVRRRAAREGGRAGERTYRFRTPTILKAEGRVEDVPAFATLVRRARDRVNALSTFFGAGPLDWDFKSMGEQAERVSISAADGRRHSHRRFSHRQRQALDLSGFVGTVRYSGPEEVFRELDTLVETLDEIHVGKGAALGNGWVQEAAE
jgi:hypothetical protein